MTRLRSRQRGVALLVALLVVALAVILVAALLDRGELALARTRNVLRGEQAEAYALGLDTYAAQVLMLTHGASPDPDTNTSPWATPLPAQPVPGGVIGASMRDLNGCFNLNNLAPGTPGDWGTVFDNLLGALRLDAQLRAAIENWLDPARIHDEENFYFAQPVPYRARGGLFAHGSELRLVRGVTSEVYARLAPHVCALPPGTKININTATVPVLMALVGPGLSQAAAQRLWQNGTAHWSTEQFTQQLTQLHVPVPPALAAQITDRSAYFLLRGDIVLDEVPFTTWSLLEHRQDGVHVVARSRGSDEALVVATPGIAPPAASAL
ncbi:type II secretion system minor pseudopilin GspK [Dokdonella sp.]|uniref:type II secretion system minor pseudopilin GspK n=1 Tax=Dokdonella sp. TaxID=2291710 RepID=UPI003785270F